MFLYFAYNNYSRQLTKYDDITYIRNIHIKNEFIKIGINQFENNDINPSSNFYDEDNQTEWDIEKGNPEEYNIYPFELNKKKLSLLIPINEEVYDRLCKEERKQYAEMNTPKYEEVTKSVGILNKKIRLIKNKK
jgi:hypothetical protein